jgi:transcriptional regulator GlxA family with amidase domain
MPRILLVVHPTAMLYEVAIAREVLDAPGYDFLVVTADGGPHPWLPAHPSAGYDALKNASPGDTVVVPSTEDLDGDPAPRLVDALTAAHARGARLASLCTGSFVVAATGVLDGRTATTHWMHADAFARRFPAVDVRADLLFTDEEDVLTSAGKSAALDLCLHLVRRDLGASAANQVARRLVVPSLRTGGQAQFIAPPAPPRSSDGLAPMLDWAMAHLDQPLRVSDLARRAGLSPRQLARRMQGELQVRPLEWLHRQRVLRAPQMWEDSEAGLDVIAARCGLGSAATLRRHFGRSLGVTPSTYRASFGVEHAPSAEPTAGVQRRAATSPSP